MESVFIAWSGNLEVATHVAEQLEGKGFRTVIGGGTPRDMFIGNQVISQMDTCAHAIILAQKKNDTSTGETAKFSENLMFEWGYMIARLSARNVYAFLLDTGERELPSDLMGSWVTSLERSGLSDQETANLIVERFEIESRTLDKLTIMSQWKEIKSIAKSHAARKSHSDFEMAQMVLFSLKSAYYHNEMPLLLAAVSQTGDATGTLRAVIDEARAISSVFVKTDNLANKLEVDDYFELTMQLSKPFEDGISEESLRSWARILRLDALSLCNVVAPSTEDESEREYYWKQSIRLGEDTLRAIDEAVAEYPEDELFASLIRSYQHRNQARAYRALGNEDTSIEHLELSMKERERFYFAFRNAYPDDGVMCSKLAQEYYLSLLEHARYEDNPIEKRRIMATVEKLMAAWQEDFERQQALLDMVKRAYDALVRL